MKLLIRDRGMEGVILHTRKQSEDCQAQVQTPSTRAMRGITFIKVCQGLTIHFGSPILLWACLDFFQAVLQVFTCR